MSKIIFETATFADAVKNADKVSPTRGQAFDKAAGILLQFDPAGVPMAVIRATNLDVYSTQWIDILEMSGGATIWRFPKLFGALIAGLPIGSGVKISLEEKDGRVEIKAGRMKARFNLLDPEYFPQWDVFDPDGMYAVNDLGGRVDQVEYACSKDIIPITGIHLDGEYAIATDRYRLAAVPLPIPDLEHPVTVPSGFLGQMLRQTGEVKIGMNGNNLQIMPDEYRQIMCVTYPEDYPPYQVFFDKTFENSVEIKKGPLVEIMRRAEQFAGNADRVGSAMKLYLGKQKIIVVMDNEEVGQLGDVMDTPAGCDHEPVLLKFASQNIIQAFDRAPSEMVTLHYDESVGRLIHVDGGSGYRAWVAVRNDKPTASTP